MDSLSEFLERNCELLARRFVEALRESGSPPVQHQEAKIGSARALLLELAARIRNGPASRPRESVAAQAHGQQRFESGSGLSALVLEYATLHHILCDARAGTPPEERCEGQRKLAGHLMRASADAVARYTQLRDEELQRDSDRRVAFFAHELRAPLNTIRLTLDLLQTEPLGACAKHLPTLEKNVALMAELLDAGVTRLRADTMPELELELIALPALLESVAEQALVQAENKHQRLVIEKAGPCVVPGDRKALWSVVSNLVHNAVKFSPVGSRIALRARCLEGRANIEVADACGGLSPGSLQDIFEPFTQAAANRSGYGLGLSIAKRAAEAHGGDLRVHNIEGRGCVFIVDIPCIVADAP